MIDAHITYGPGGRRELEIVQAPGWAVIAERAAGTACRYTGHGLCGCWEWTHHVRIPRTGRPDDLHAWSLGNLMTHIGMRTNTIAERRQTTILRIPVTREFIAEHFPDAAWLDDDPDG